ncbi:MAG: anaerobic sulfatase maturase [Candidatus Accumulibacter sp.]|jgi:uncharacterized protein|nr:anaerobic sulfatase maturase [Accumulibacter sp.]
MNEPLSPFHVLAKPVGALCNLRCEYCYYLEKDKLYPGRKASRLRMADETLEALIKSVIQARLPWQKEVHFSWQGGEPSLTGLQFFKKVVALQRIYAPRGLDVYNEFQTNGTLVSDDFARFFHDHSFLIGVSIDGPEMLHDRFRRYVSGQGSFKAVMRGIERLDRHKVEYNLLTVVQNHNSRYPEDVYRFLISLGSAFIQFIPLVEKKTDGMASSRSVSGEAWGNFLNRVFHLWRLRDIGAVFIQYFDTVLGLSMGLPSALCVHAKECGRALALEHNGDLYCCDHYVDPEHKLGNLRESSLLSMTESEEQRLFGKMKYIALSSACRRCEFLHLCNGGCPKDRIDINGEEENNWLCSGYKAFYKESLPYFSAMADALRHHFPASEYQRFMIHAADAAGSRRTARR